jgi:hypothetical protein
LPGGGIVIAKLEVDEVAELINQRVVGLDREVDKDLVISRQQERLLDEQGNPRITGVVRGES